MDGCKGDPEHLAVELDPLEHLDQVNNKKPAVTIHSPIVDQATIMEVE